MNIHHEFADSMFGIDHASLEADRQAQLHADYGPKDRAEGVLYTAPQGRTEQGWPMRRCSPEMAVWDSTQDDPPREEMTPAEAWLLCAIFCVSAVFVVWLLVTVARAFGVAHV